MPSKICNSCHELKDYELFPIQAAHSTGRGTQCKQCMAVKHRAYYEANKERVLKRNKAHRTNNQEWAQKNRERAKAAYYANKGQTHARVRKRQAAKINRTPPWLSLEQKAEIQRFYDEAVRLTATLKESYVVDHIVPLQGKTVSGLHVPWNLQILRRGENASKGATF